MALDFTHYRHGIAVADGDLVGELILRGWDSGVPTELAAVRRGDILGDAAQAFLEAGAELLTTCTDRANALAWQDCGGMQAEANADLPALNHAAARLLREAVSDFPGAEAIVLGTLGPLQRLFVLDELDEDAVIASYREQAKALVSGGVDGLLFRGFTELRCLELALRAAREVCDLPVIGCMRFECGLERGETSLGATAPQVCAVLEQLGVDAVGCDASEDPDATPDVVSMLKTITKLPIWVSLHPGRPELAEGAVRYTEAPAAFGQRLPALLKAGACVIGGATGTTTSHIAALVAARQRMK